MSNQFSSLGISAEITKSLDELNISVPTEIQEKTIPILLSKTEDFVGLAKTGTGKTAAFGLPLLQLINAEESHIQAVILVPTRELVVQVAGIVENLTKNITARVIGIYGGKLTTSRATAQKVMRLIKPSLPARIAKVDVSQLPLELL